MLKLNEQTLGMLAQVDKLYCLWPKSSPVFSVNTTFLEQ